ncbi:MAG: endonuclease/exonuclease/phosphatase family protein, partial [Taibaiella sp.]|nr:endonuclease/exonuclease/phosphatase family protein [Taibaiella sp.]
MKKFAKLFIAVLVLLAAGCKKNEAPDYTHRTSYFNNIVDHTNTDGIIKCVTYNIRLGFSGDYSDPWDKNSTGVTEDYLDSIKQLILATDPDIICLQEVPRNRYNAVIKNFIERLAAVLNMNYAFGAHGYNDPSGIEPVHGEWGNAILSKYRITGIENHENEYNNVWERRSILSATMQINGYDVVIYSLHFLPSPSAVPNALHFFQKERNKHQIIMGDFNMVKVPELEQAGYIDILVVDTSIATSAIDRMFISEERFAIHEYGGVTG